MSMNMRLSAGNSMNIDRKNWGEIRVGQSFLAERALKRTIKSVTEKLCIV